MQKSLVISVLVILTMLPLASAVGLFDFITGKATQGDSNVTVAIANSAPTLPAVFAPTNFQLVGTSTANLVINFTVRDDDRSTDINRTASYIQLHGPSSCSSYMRNSTNTCTNTTSAANNNKFMNFTCTIVMNYWDCPGTWTINASATDLSSAVARNDTATLTVDALQYVTITPSLIDFGTLVVSSNNRTAITNTTVNNTGNDNVTNLRVNSTNLIGETDNSFAITAENFSATTHSTIASRDACDTVTGTSNGQQLVRYSYVNITSTSGNGSGNPNAVVRNETGALQQNIEVRYCLQLVPDVIKQNYTTVADGAWIIKAF